MKLGGMKWLAYDESHIGGRIRKARQYAGIPLAHLADLCGVSESSLQRIETDRARIERGHQAKARFNEYLLPAICSACCVSGDYLLGLLQTIDCGHTVPSRCCPHRNATILRDDLGGIDGCYVHCYGCSTRYGRSTVPEDVYHLYCITNQEPFRP